MKEYNIKLKINEVHKEGLNLRVSDALLQYMPIRNAAWTFIRENLDFILDVTEITEVKEDE